MWNTIFEFGSSGILLGLTAGISPGPLMTLVISQTMLYNKSEGFKVAVAPLITDIPIVLITLFIISQLNSFDKVAGVISMLGGLFIFYLARDTFISADKAKIMEVVKAGSYRKGILVNFLSPHPYLFWLLVGAPLYNQANEASSWAAVAFLGGFYMLLVGSKILIAILTEKSKGFLKSRYYKYLLQVLAIALTLFGLKLLIEGWMFIFKV